MAKYLGTDGKTHSVNLLSYEWELCNKENENVITFYTPEYIPQEIFKHDEDIFDESIPFYWLEVCFFYETEDVLGLNPIFSGMQYTIGDRTVCIEINKKEREFFNNLLLKEIGDQHTPEMQKIMTDYYNSVDKEIYAFVEDVEANRDVLPLTVGFVSTEMANKIKALTGCEVAGNRIVLGADDVRHILNRHGKNGKADNSMAETNDIARMSYILANYDSIDWDGGVSKLYKTKDGRKAPQVIIKKRINGTYYVIQVVSDSKKNRNIVSTCYLQKTNE